MQPTICAILSPRNERSPRRIATQAPFRFWLYLAAHHMLGLFYRRTTTYCNFPLSRSQRQNPERIGLIAWLLFKKAHLRYWTVLRPAEQAQKKLRVPETPQDRRPETYLKDSLVSDSCIEIESSRSLLLC